MAVRTCMIGAPACRRRGIGRQLSASRRQSPQSSQVSARAQENRRPKPLFYLALLIGLLSFFFGMTVFLSLMVASVLRWTSRRENRRFEVGSVFLERSRGAPCTLPGSSTAGLGPSERSSSRRGTCCYRTRGASSQAFRRGPGLLRPQARYRASRIPWSAPFLSAEADLLCVQVAEAASRMMRIPVMRRLREACDPWPRSWSWRCCRQAGRGTRCRPATWRA